MTATFEEFMEHRVQPKHRDIVEAFRKQVKRVAPEISERMRGGTEKYYSVPVYRLDRDIVAISPTKTGITFSFTKGASFDDPYGLLAGVGKHSRTVRVSKLDKYPVEAMKSYIMQAVEMDKQ